MSDLPVFAFCEPEAQAEQVKSQLKVFGADVVVVVDGGGDGTDQQSVIGNLNEIIDHLGVLGKVDDAEAEAVLNSVVSLFTLLSRDQAPPLVEKLCRKLSSAAEFAGKEALVIRALSNVFHAFGDQQQQLQTATTTKPGQPQPRYREQYLVYCTMLKVAASAGLIKTMITDLDRLKVWFDAWDATVDERRQCLRLLHDALVKSHQVEAPAKVMYELLSSYSTEADAATAKEDAGQCIRSAVLDPGAFVFDHLLGLRPVQSLKGTKIYDLLQIFVDGSLKDYLQFYQANRAFVDNGLAEADKAGGTTGAGGGDPHSANVHKMRVLTLMSIGEAKTELKLDALGKELDLEDGEQLEEFIIKCIQSKTIKAKIDQMNGKLIIGGVKNRSFAKPQWETLKSKLDTWAASLKSVKGYLETVEAAES